MGPTRRRPTSLQRLWEQGQPNAYGGRMAYGCDYGHQHRSLAAKRRCEERNDNRGLPRGAR